MCNHMETASHSSFIKPFIALIAVGALFYELLNNLAARMYISGAASSQLSPGQRVEGTEHATSAEAMRSLLCGERSGPQRRPLCHEPFEVKRGQSALK